MRAVSDDCNAPQCFLNRTRGPKTAPSALRKAEQPAVIAELAPDIDRNDRLGSVCNQLVQLVKIEKKTVLCDVAEDDLGSDMLNDGG